MDIQFFGANCIAITHKKARIVIDDNLADLGGTSITKDGDVALFTGPHGLPAVKPQLVLDHPGEFEVSEMSIYAIAAQAHIDEKGKKDATMYKLVIDDVRIFVAGHIYPELSERQLEEIGTVDIMIVPVGGNGLTVDAVGALKLIKKIEPKLVIPTHFDDGKLQYSVPQQTLEQALTSLAMEPQQTTDKLKVKTSDFIEGTHLVVLTAA